MKKLLAISITICTLVLVALLLFPIITEPDCLSMAWRSQEHIQIPLPANCTETPTIAEDQTVKYLEHERSRRGLAFRGWITCEGAPKRVFAFLRDPRWLPSYVPGTYQFRRTVLIVPFAHAASQSSPVQGEICVMPWLKYCRQIAGQCSGKFSGWK